MEYSGNRMSANRFHCTVCVSSGEEDFLFTEKLFAPPRSYAKFMQQRYPDHTFKFKNLDDVSEVSRESHHDTKWHHDSYKFSL